MTPEEIAALPYRPCVGVMLVNRSGQIFVGQRIDAPKLGTQDTAWQMPQGGVDPGEDPHDAALRELWEETGVVADLVTIEAEHPNWLAYDLPHDIVPKIWKGRYRGQEQKWFLLRFHGEDTDVNIAMDHPEFAQWRWIGADEIIDHIVPFKREIYRAVIEEFQHRL